ncbi:Uncharacterized conserved protein YkwD, contains CAP (CSP/antigen 5/PR1) domain [Actinoplanes derwentensis]|uniref:Uncharacterized conserved protein YkwD, contains CAP (CSP/antigen 5/PR1) domain n=1 Tax=Actinoplanes derwentensis TaxID=113562 RepID=A0A1H2DC77_9ACTN|nr:Uncharacterized conserved protein YkwD, contains CAP (CSP/antigen 5/PR1) domain [Actinoplanes derwentensis]
MVIGAAFLVAGLAPGGTESVEPTAVTAPLAAAAPPGGDETEPVVPESAAASPSATTASPSPSVKSKSPSPKVTAKKTATASTSKKASTSSGASKTTVPVTSGTVAEQVLAHINEARVAEGLKAVTLDADLSKAAAIHTQLMIDGCGLSHLCSGEADLGDRFSAQGVSWSRAAENIGYGSSGSSTSAMVGAANGLTDSMLAEVPPNDGHRENLLNAAYTRIGLSIVRDAKGMTWMTQDFVG